MDLRHVSHIKGEATLLLSDANQVWSRGVRHVLRFYKQHVERNLWSRCIFHPLLSVFLLRIRANQVGHVRCVTRCV